VQHRPLHSGAYYQAVNLRLAGAVDYKDVAMRLFEIGSLIRLGKPL